MIKFEKITPGMTLYDVRKHRGFSLPYSKWDTWPVFVTDVDTGKRMVLASWNHNKARWISERTVCKYRAKRPSRER